MSTGVFAAVLGAALLHAAWNALIKRGGDGLATMGAMAVTQGAIGLTLAAMSPWPVAAAWLWIIASAVLHTGYRLALTFAYRDGDLSRVYPIARGTAPVFVLVIGWLALGEALNGTEVLGVLVLVVGILAMARGVWTSGESLRLLPFALGSALATMGYSLVDGIGARIAGDAVQYLAWMFLLDASLFLPLVFAFRRRRVVPDSGRVWAQGAAAAVVSYAAYQIVVWAMTQAPIALVTALRETSILFAVLIGWLLFGETMNRGKAVAAGLILAGVVLTRL